MSSPPQHKVGRQHDGLRFPSLSEGETGIPLITLCDAATRKGSLWSASKHRSGMRRSAACKVPRLTAAAAAGRQCGKKNAAARQYLQ